MRAFTMRLIQEQLVKVLKYHNTSTFKQVWQTLTTFCMSPTTYISALSHLIYLSAVIAIGLLVFTSIFAILVMNNFGRGLKEQSTCSSFL